MTNEQTMMKIDKELVKKLKGLKIIERERLQDVVRRMIKDKRLR